MKAIKSLEVTDGMAVGGGLCVSAGIGMFNVAAGIIALGVFLILAAVFIDATSAKKEGAE